MNNQENYNGWTNYETWLVKLWIDNDEASLDEARDTVLDAALADQDGEYQKPWMRAERALKDLITEWTEQDETSGLAADLMNAALGEVNFKEIAESILEELKEDGTYEEPTEDAE